MMKTKNICIHTLLAAAAASILLLFGAVSAFAAEYESDLNSDGSVSVKNSETGEVIAKLNMEGANIDRELVSDGKVVYFTTYEPVSTYSDETNCYLYRYDIATENYMLLKKLSDPYYQFDVNMLYSNSLYLSGWNPSDDAVGYRYYIKTGTLKKIADGACAYRYKNYVVCETTMVHGAFTPYPIYVYNTKTKKTKTIIKNVANYTPSKKYLYIAKLKKNTYSPETGATYQIVRYNLLTGKKKVMKKTFKGYWIGKITSKYIYQMKQKNGKSTWYRYSFAAKKNKKISQAAYNKALGIK